MSAERKSAMSAVVVVLAPLDIANWSPYSQQLSCFTEDDGACEIGAPPGEYRVLTVTASGGAGTADVDLKRRALAAPRVTLAAGETKDFEVTVTEK